MADTRLRAISRIVGRVLLAVVVALVLAGALLVLLSYTGAEIGLVEVGIAVVLSGAIVFAWTRWR